MDIDYPEAPTRQTFFRVSRLGQRRCLFWRSDGGSIIADKHNSYSCHTQAYKAILWVVRHCSGVAWAADVVSKQDTKEAPKDNPVMRENCPLYITKWGRIVLEEGHRIRNQDKAQRVAVCLVRERSVSWYWNTISE